MTNAVIFALLSLCFAGLNDVAFKRYSAKDRSRGMLVFGIGLVWALLQCFPGRAATCRTPLLHEFRGAEIYPERRSGEGRLRGI